MLYNRVIALCICRLHRYYTINQINIVTFCASARRNLFVWKTVSVSAFWNKPKKTAGTEGWQFYAHLKSIVVFSKKYGSFYYKFSLKREITKFCKNLSILTLGTVALSLKSFVLK